MNEIKISLNEVEETAYEIRRLNAQLEEIINNIYKLINELNTYWNSEGSEVYEMKYNEFSKLLKEETNDIYTYANFLDYTVKSYETLEETIKINASKIS